MASNETWAGAAALGLQYVVYCDPCDKIATIDPAKMPPDGRAIGVSFRRSDCGCLGYLTVNPKSALRAVPKQRPLPNSGVA